MRISCYFSLLAALLYAQITVAQESEVVPVAETTENQRPVAIAEAQPIAIEVGKIGRLDGSASNDSEDGKQLQYQWVQVSGTPVELRDANKSIANFTAPPSAGEEDNLEFELTVTDSAGLIDTFFITITLQTLSARSEYVVFNTRTGNLNIPHIDAGELGAFDVLLRLIDTQQFIFELNSLIPLPKTESAKTPLANFNPLTGIVEIASVSVINLDGSVNSFRVSLTSIPNTAPPRFRLGNVTPLP